MKIRTTLFLLFFFAAPAAHADAWTWGGRVGRLEVRVTRTGFNDGAGVGGWDADEARAFARWARRLAAALPADAGLLLACPAADALPCRSRGGHVALTW